MLTPERLLGIFIELIFVMLGGLLIWLGLRGPISGRIVDRHSVSWLILGVALTLWGLRALYKPGISQLTLSRSTIRPEIGPRRPSQISSPPSITNISSMKIPKSR